jgi:hypothetical protein
MNNQQSTPQSIGLAGRIARAFIESRLTPMASNRKNVSMPQAQ